MKYLIPLLCLLMLVACGGGDSPTDPGDGGGDGGPTFEDTPPIPRPSSPGGDAPATSETLTLVSDGSLQTFAPQLVDFAIGQGVVRARALSTSSCGWTTIQSFTGGNMATLNGSINRTFSSCGSTFFLTAQLADLRPTGRRVLVSDGTWVRAHSRQRTAGSVIGFPISGLPGLVRLDLQALSAPEERPHLRRDRYWRLRSLAGGVGNFLLLTGPTSGEISTTYTRGVERTDTESFGRSVTGEVSASYGVVSASVSATLSEEFTTSVTVSESQSETFTQTVYGEDGKTIQFMVWELVEVYSISDADGESFQPEGWTFTTETLTRAGAALALDATSFPSN